MLEKILARLFNGTKQIKLSPDEMLQIGNSVQNFCAKHPVREEVVLRPISVMTHDPFVACREEELSVKEKVKAWKEIQAYTNQSPIHEQQYTFFGLLHSYFLQNQFVAGALAVFLLIGAGTGLSYAAESALPSDFLYFIKVNVNEPIVESFPRTSAKQAEVQMRHLQRRATEVQILAGKEKLEDSDTERLEQSITTFMSRIESKIAEIDRDSPDAENVIRQYRHVLTMQESALQALQNEHVTAKRIEQILQQVKSARVRFDESASARSVFMKETTIENTSIMDTIEHNSSSQGNSVHINSNTTTNVHVKTNTESNSEVRVDSQSSVSGNSEVDIDSASSIINEVNEKIEKQRNEVHTKVDLDF